MRSAEEIVDQIQQGQIPEHWHMIKGRGSPLKAALRTLVFYVLGWLIAASFYYAIRGKISTPDPYVVGIWALSLMIPLFRAWQWGKGAQHSFLIMEPEGCMFLTHSNNPAKRRLIPCFYMYMSSIELKLRLPNSPVRLLNYPVRMTICCYDGTQFWVDLDNRFGPPLKIAQAIIVAHTRYSTLHPHEA